MSGPVRPQHFTVRYGALRCNYDGYVTLRYVTVFGRNYTVNSSLGADPSYLGIPIVRQCEAWRGFNPTGLWPMMRHKAVLERYAALRCLWHG
eukprot:2465509-Prymnesium_polylepis.1